VNEGFLRNGPRPLLGLVWGGELSAAQPVSVPTSVVHDSGDSLPLPSLELTVLMPCLDESETVGTCVEKAVGFLAEHHTNGEVLVADNGSTDDSQRITESAGAPVFSITERGYGNTLLGGVVAARGWYVLTSDGTLGGPRVVNSCF